MIGNRAVTGGIAATSPVLAWTAVALVDVQIAIRAGASLCRTVHDCALLMVLGDVRIVTHATSKSYTARTSISVQLYRLLPNAVRIGLCAGRVVSAWIARAFVDVYVAVACATGITTLQYSALGSILAYEWILA
jgi:hypothetical protein